MDLDLSVIDFSLFLFLPFSKLEKMLRFCSLQCRLMTKLALTLPLSDIGCTGLWLICKYSALGIAFLNVVSLVISDVKHCLLGRNM